ncbi:DUF4252 domain-containing protein [Echinicola sp. CAU 1574]|uniref:DUF4252 domain-containing protein n=1 Tax=Echinicola arenosa TaxID=2774144 RepID=A0ABR9ALC0_9BACT|nr:DUF4252 domain-containing protein [Echinicola arenosa]MBD8488419.1 DUF4252 domain-containing protein [Echinicola arenosa]
MKKLLMIVALMGMSLFAQAQSKSVASLYEKYKGTEEFFHLDLAGSFFDFAEGFDIDFDEEGMKAIAKSVERMKLFKLPVNGSEAKADFKALAKGLKKEKYELMMELSEKDSEIAFYSKGDDIISDLVLLIGGDDDDSHLVIELEGAFESKAIASSMP